MGDDRLPQQVLVWDAGHGCKGWMHDITEVSNMLNITIPENIGIVYDPEPIKNLMLRKNREEWKSAAEEMPKLVTYVKVKDFTENGLMVKSNLACGERSVLAHWLCGILPLKIKIGRVSGKDCKDRKDRFCRVCNKREVEDVEDEIHFLMKCEKLKEIREATINLKLGESHETTGMSDIEKVRWLLHPANIKVMGEHIHTMFQARQDCLYKLN